jgi:hypothetical protein
MGFTSIYRTDRQQLPVSVSVSMKCEGRPGLLSGGFAFQDIRFAERRRHLSRHSPRHFHDAVWLSLQT